jgi:hypothetical protein
MTLTDNHFLLIRQVFSKKGGCPMRASYKHMDFLGPVEQTQLTAAQPGPCVSIYLPIAAHGGVEVQAEPLRLRQLLAQAEAKLLARGLSSNQVAKLLAPATNLVEGNLSFWQYQSDGLAFFLNQETALVYRLPLSFKEQVVIDEHFYIRPLIPLLSGDGVFHLLVVSQNQVRLWRGSQYVMSEIPIETIPHSLAEATQYDQVEPVRTAHSIASSGTGRGRRAVAFHGQGSAGDEKLVKESLRQYLQQVEAGVRAVLADQRTPLVLAGVDYLCDLYRSINHYRALCAETVEGNPDRASTEELQARAWRIVAPIFQQERTEALARYNQLAGQASPRAVWGVEAVVNAAHVGRVEALFLASDEPAWGEFDPATGRVTRHQEAEHTSEELLNLAVVQTLKQGGVVYAVESNVLLDNVAVAALLRF